MRTSAQNVLYPQPASAQSKADGPPQGPAAKIYPESEMARYGLEMNYGETCWVEPDYRSQPKVPELTQMAPAITDNDSDENIIRY